MKIVSELILRLSMLVLVAPMVPVTDEIAYQFRQVSEVLEQVQYLSR